MSAAPEEPTQTSIPTSAVTALTALAVIPLLVFHTGAAYLSYQKYGSFLWALVDFVFAYFYYPYYAFFLAGSPAPPMMGGGMMKMLKKMIK
jgi:hypothetical protein